MKKVRLLLIASSPFLMPLFFSFGCATPKIEKVDTSSIVMPKTAQVERSAGSLWPGETTRNSFFQDTRARNIGDIVTVSIVEEASGSKEANTDTSRESETGLEVSNFMGIPLGSGGKWSQITPSISASSKNTFKGDASTSRSDKILGTIAVRVTEVLSNGNLFIEGTKETVLNSEKQYIILNGIIRPEDISGDNTISSNYISDARISYSGNGVLSEKQNPGWFARVLDVVWPF